jgi:retron-type reverse transcriptase
MGFWDSVKKLFGGESAPAEPSAEPSDGAAEPGAAVARGGAYRSAPREARADSHVNPYGASPVMGFSQGEVRARFFALRRGGISTFFHPDLLPPPDDEFTQLVDRSLVLSGLLSQAELEQIHRVGLEWRKYRDARSHARIVGKAKGEEAVAELKRQRAERREARREVARQKREAHEATVERRRREDIIHLGDGVSGSLGDRRSHIERLTGARLPLLSAPADIALALEVSVGQLRWLCFHAETSRVAHYRQFAVPKRSGGMRLLAAPLPHLDKAQRWIFDNILSKLDVEDAAHGFRRGRSTVSNARPHVGQDIVINLDLEDFFPTVTFPRVRGVFERLGYSPAASTILALLTTECPRQAVRYGNERYLVAIGDRCLPQGACTSPALANQVTRRLDRRLSGLCRALGWQYTRYADDLSFSAPKGKRDEIPRLLGAVRRLVEDEGFALHRDKRRIQRSGGRQEVTGLGVNHKLGLPREEVRRLRAILHKARTTGLEAQNRAGIPHFRAHLEGKLAYLAMIDRPRGEAMLTELRALAP